MPASSSPNPAPGPSADAVPTPATDLAGMHQNVVTELEAIQNAAAKLSDGCSRESGLFSVLHYTVGVPSIVLGAVAGAVAISKSAPLFAGVCALAATALTGVQTFIHADRRRISDRLLAADFQELADDARVTRELDLESMSTDRQRQALEEAAQSTKGPRTSMRHGRHEDAVGMTTGQNCISVQSLYRRSDPATANGFRYTVAGPD